MRPRGAHRRPNLAVDSLVEKPVAGCSRGSAFLICPCSNPRCPGRWWVTSSPWLLAARQKHIRPFWRSSAITVALMTSISRSHNLPQVTSGELAKCRAWLSWRSTGWLLSIAIFGPLRNEQRPSSFLGPEFGPSPIRHGFTVPASLSVPALLHHYTCRECQLSANPCVL